MFDITVPTTKIKKSRQRRAPRRPAISAARGAASSAKVVSVLWSTARRACVLKQLKGYTAPTT
eukprot:4693710-Pleurochrysis_carterae.AAC.2